MAKVPLIVTAALVLLNAMPESERQLFREMFDSDGLLTRAAEHRDEAEAGGQTCPSCEGAGVISMLDALDLTCSKCHGTGKV